MVPPRGARLRPVAWAPCLFISVAVPRAGAGQALCPSPLPFNCSPAGREGPFSPPWPRSKRLQGEKPPAWGQGTLRLGDRDLNPDLFSFPRPGTRGAGRAHPAMCRCSDAPPCALTVRPAVAQLKIPG